MTFLVAVHYVIFLLVLILHASLENKFFFFFCSIALVVNKTPKATTGVA